MTQVFSPEITYKEERDFTERFLKNVLTYFKDFKKNKVFKIKIEPEPWSVLAGKKIGIKVKTKEKIKRIDLEILTPEGNREKIKGIDYTPKEGGTYQVKTKVTTEDGKVPFGFLLIIR